MRSIHPLSIPILVAAFATMVAVPAAAGPIEQPPRLVTFKLDDAPPSRLALLSSFHESALAHPARSPSYLTGSFGRWGDKPWWTLSWFSAESGAAEENEPRAFGFEPAPSVDALSLPTDALHEWLRRFDPGGVAPVVAWPTAATIVRTPFATFASDGSEAIWSLPPRKPIRDWRCLRRPVRFVRMGAETDTFELVRCDGSVAAGALDRVSLMARTADAPRTGELLPDEPDPEARARGEWSEGVRVVNPRLLWALQRIADAFPWRTIYVFSGYRRPPPHAKPGGHHSLHGEARAMDITVMGVPNEALFDVCRKLDDVGCGYYPNNKFVHVDVRRTGTGHAFWIDVSAPGEPSRYVDAWPGVVESGALVWDSARRDADVASPTAR